MPHTVARSFNTNMVSGGPLDPGNPMVAPEVTDINTQPGCFWTIPPDMTHSSSLDHYKAMTSSGSTVPLDEHGLGVAQPSDTDIVTGYSSDARHLCGLVDIMGH